MTAFEIVCNGLGTPHDGEFREAMRPELQRRMLEFSPEEWNSLEAEWQRRGPEWQFNLADTLAPGRHGEKAVQLLRKMLLQGSDALLVTVAEKLEANQALDDATRTDLLARFEAAQPIGAHETLHLQQLRQQILREDLRPAIAEASEFSIRQRKDVETSSLAACYYCQTVFSPAEVTEYADNGETALCPFCGVDAVLPSNAGYPFSEAGLRALHEYWFG